VKWKWTRGCCLSHACTAGVLWVEELSRITCTPARDSRGPAAGGRQEIGARMLRAALAQDFALATSRAAYKLVKPLRW